MNRTLLYFMLGGLSLMLGAESVQAQSVVSDGSLNTIVTPSGNVFTIDNGTTAGTNLFHSFREFSIPTGGSAVFNNASNIQNIFSRVTGGTLSSINGAIQAQGSANLFLLNPAGMLFGANASLNIGGSFVGTTANSIKFADGMEFSATNLNDRPLLTMSAPIGLQFGSQPGSITHQATTGFQVAPGKTLALVGGTLIIPGGTLMAPAGNIELGSVTGNSHVGTNPTTFAMSYAGATGFQDINLSQKAQVDASGEGGGSIHVQARQFSLQQGAQLRSNTLGSEPGRPITIRASERVEIAGAEDLSPYSVYYGSENFDTSGLGGIYAVAQGGTGRGGSIRIESPYVLLSQAGAIVSNTRGQGDAGDLTIQTHTLEIQGNPNGNGFPSLLDTATIGSGHGGNLTINADRFDSKEFALVQSYVDGTGDAGDITVNVRQFRALNGTQFLSSIFKGEGNGGDITINATESVELKGFNFWELGLFSTALSSGVEPNGAGKGGNVTITTRRLSILQGATIAANVSGNGQPGNIIIRANEIEVADPKVGFGGTVSGIIASVKSGSTAQGGSLDIVTDQLRVLRGGQITAATDGFGNAGSINIQAKDIDIDGISEDGQFRSSIVASSTTHFRAGSIYLTTDSLRVRNGANITVSNTGTGDAGNLDIKAGSIFLNHGASLQAEVNGGGQGNIQLRTQEQLLLRQGSRIIATATGDSTGGNITISAPVILGLEDSDIVANAEQGQGGRIQITTQGMFGLQYRDRTTPANDITASSQFGINGTVQINHLGVDLDSGLIELPADLTDVSEQITKGCATSQGSRFVITRRGGLPTNPLEERVGSSRSWADLRHLATRQSTNIANSSPTARFVEATSWDRNPQTGKVELIAERSVRSTQSVTCS